MDSASRRAWRRVMHSSVRSWVLDVALGVVAAYAAVILTVEFYGFLSTPAQVAAVLLAGVYGAAVTFRRVALRAVVAVQVITAVGYVALGLPVYALGPAVLVTLYTVGSRLSRRPAPDPAGCGRGGAGGPAAARIDRAFHVGVVCGHFVRRLVPRRCHAPVAGRGDRARAARNGAGTGPHRAGPPRSGCRAAADRPRAARRGRRTV